MTPATDAQSIESETQDAAKVDLTKTANQHASTTLVTQDPALLQDTGASEESGKQLIRKYCCGGGCCLLTAPPPALTTADSKPLELPENDAFRSLKLKLGTLTQDTELTGVTDLPRRTISFSSTSPEQSHHSTVYRHPPSFVKPHPPHDVFSAPLYSARELTNKGAEKRTFHFDIDVTDYPDEGGDIDWKVGGAVGICPPNDPSEVDEIFDVLRVPRSIRDKPAILHTTNGRWPTVWGDEKPRSLPTTRRELLTWCSDIQSYPPTKQLLRVLAEYATDSNEKKLLLYLCSAQGQHSFCDLRTGPHISLTQLLHAFPSSIPSLPHLLSVLHQLMPRFYSLSNDPHVSSTREGLANRRLIEIAVTVHESPNWRGGPRTGVGSGYLERIANTYIRHTDPGALLQKLDLRIPLFRGLMSNPLSRSFTASEGPMLLIGAGVGMAPFRGFIHNRLRNASCAQKIWLIQGVRDASIDELYSGELGAYERDIKRVVQSRRGRASHKSSESDLGAALKRAGAGAQEADRTRSTSSGHFREHDGDGTPESRYVQDEVKQQADVVWDVIRSVDGRVFVCGSSKGMGEGVESALRWVALRKNVGWNEEAAGTFWEEMKRAGKFVAETW